MPPTTPNAPATPKPPSPYEQAGSAIRFDWGLSGATAVAAGAAAVVVVDVLSFSTTLTVALELGVEVFPYRFRDASAAAFAASRGAVLAVGRREAMAPQPGGPPAGVSLSPTSVRGASEAGVFASTPRLVLPSPNGAAICRAMAETPIAVVGACLRNAEAVARWAKATMRGPIAVVAAGERWPGDQLRPAVEDLWGAGAVVAALRAESYGTVSAEAAAAEAAYRAMGRSPLNALRSCASGRELVDDGYGDEISVAAEVGRSRVVPVMSGDSFKPG